MNGRGRVSFTLEDVKLYLRDKPPLPDEEIPTREEVEGMLNDARWLDGEELVEALEEVARLALEGWTQTEARVPEEQD